MDAAPGIRVGVTGHRSFPGHDETTAAVDAVLDTLDPPAVVISALAEGADRLVAQRALSRSGWSLTAVLPMPLGDYLADFDEASQWELVDLLERAEDLEELEGAEDRDDAYLRCGMRIVDGSDALIALWDGQPAFGKGGTADIVAYARGLDRPLAWITVANTIREAAGDDAAEVSTTLERWPWTP